MPPPMLARGAALALATMLLAAAVHAKDVSSAAPAFERSGPAPARVATSDGQWIRLSPPPPRSRHSAAYDSVRDQMVVVCGLSSVTGKAVNEVWVLSMLGVPSWRKVVTLGAPPPARYYQTLIHDIARDRLIMMGGYDGVSFKNDVWALSLADFSWTQLSPTGTPPSVRWGHVAAYDAAGDRMVVFGGQTTGGTLLNDAWQLSLAGSTTWTLLSPTGTKPSARRFGAAAFDPVRNQLVIHGGLGAGAASLGDAWTLSLAPTPSWSALTPSGTPPVARAFQSATYDPAGDRIVILAGTTSANVNEAWSLSLSGGGAWSPITPSGVAPSGRSSHSAVFDATRARVLMYAGFDSGYLGDLWSLSLAGAPAWVELPVSSQAIPVGRMGQTTAFDPIRHRMVIFGGNNSNNTRLNDVWALPLGPGMQWVPLVPAGTPPSGRMGSSAVFDPVRDRMLVFGGVGGVNPGVNEVWELSFSGVPTWTQLQPTGTPPSGRGWHAAIYDPVRDRMVVHGGYDLNWRSDTWELTLSGTPNWSLIQPTGTTPTGRSHHAAVYDAARDRLIFWGGQGEPTQSPTFDAGAAWALNFGSTPWWEMLTATGAPKGRYGAAVAYDPDHDRMLMYGGQTGVNTPPNYGYSDELWEFALSGTGTWRQLSPTGSKPAGRMLASGAYDPGRHEFMLFGGYNYDGTGYYLNDSWALYLDEVLAVSPHSTPLALAPARPNPSPGGLVTLSFTLPTAARAKLSVYDVSGRAVRSLIDGDLAAGEHTVRWDGRTALGTQAPAGLYFYELRAGGGRLSRRVVVIP